MYMCAYTCRYIYPHINNANTKEGKSHLNRHAK